MHETRVMNCFLSLSLFTVMFRKPTTFATVERNATKKLMFALPGKFQSVAKSMASLLFIYFQVTLCQPQSLSIYLFSLL